LAKLQEKKTKIYTDYTFKYAAVKNSTGVLPKLMAWPRNGIVDGIYGGAFYNSNTVTVKLLSSCLSISPRHSL